MPAPTYLIKNRFGIYYYRFVLPKAILSKIPAFKKEVRLSTRCRSIRHASRIAAYWHHTFFSITEQLNRYGKVMDDWAEDNNSSDFNFTPSTEAEEYIERVSYAQALSVLLQRKDEAMALCEMYADIMGRPVKLEDFNLFSSQAIQHFSTVAHILATEDVDDPSDYLKTLPIKPLNERDEEPLPSVIFSGYKKYRRTTDLAEPDNIPTFGYDEIQKAVFQVTSNYFKGEKTTLRIGTKKSGVVITDLSIDGAEDAESLREFLEGIAEPALISDASSSIKTLESQANEPEHKIRFSQLVQNYVPKRLKNLQQRQNRSRVTSAMGLFSEYFSNDPWVHQVSREMAEELLSVLLRLPANRKTRKESKDLTLKQLLKRDWEKTLGSTPLSRTV